MSSSVSKLSIFISWAGTQAEALGRGFHEFLPDVVNAVDPFMSGHDIDKGSQWRNVLTGNLQSSSCAIVCLTPESLKSTWVAFEAGAISRAAGGPEGAQSRVWTYLLGLETKALQLTPYAEYQATATTEEDTLRLIKSINQLSPDPVSPECLKRRFDSLFWPNFSRSIEAARALPAGPVPAASSDGDVNAEILRTLRSIQQDITRPPLPRSRFGDFALINALISEMRKRGYDVVPISRPDGGWVFQCGSQQVSFSPGTVERQVGAGSLTVSALADIITNDFTPPPTGSGLGRDVPSA
jgi:hypothetical protein